MSFTPRTSDSGISSSLYWIGDQSGGYNPINVNNPLTHPSLIGNCTWYSLGRSYEIAGKDVSDELPSLGNAQDWFTNSACSWERDGYADPSAHSGASIDVELGDILCFSVESGYESTYFGHVEIVEAINSDGTVTVSYSDYGRLFFDTATQSVYVNAPCHLTSHERLQGVIHNPYAGSTPPTPTTQYTLTLNVSPSGYGYWSGSPAGDYDEGSAISITAVANSGYQFVKAVSAEGYEYTSADMPIERNMTKDRTYTAYFEVDPKYITLMAKIINDEEGKPSEITIYL